MIGPNGAGKTTLFKMITGQEKPDGGTIKLGESVKLGYVDQSRDHLNDKKTVWEEVSGGLDIMKLGDKMEMPSRAYVSWFNFKGADQQKKVGLLSGGERNRVHLAKMLKEGGNLLLLDEPTNDLDTETLSALEAALEDFAGCAVVISHDRFFLDRMATHILAFEGDSHVEWFEGNFQDYEEDKKRRLGDAVGRAAPHQVQAVRAAVSRKVSQVSLKSFASAIITFLAAAISFSQASAQDAAAVAGDYCLVGVMEVGSCIGCPPAAGSNTSWPTAPTMKNRKATWKWENGEVVLDSPAYDRRPTFAFKRMQPGDAGTFDVIVETKSGRSLAGIDVGVTCDGATESAGMTQEANFAVRCKSAPTSLALGLRMFDVAPQEINVADRAGSGNVYVFEFDPGDLGRKPFVAHRMRPDGADTLAMIYRGSPISELEGRTFRYVRSR